MNKFTATLVERRGASITILRSQVDSTTYLLLSITYQQCVPAITYQPIVCCKQASVRFKPIEKEVVSFGTN
jgi:hypothetical protein